MEQARSMSGARLVANLGWVQRLALSIARNPDAADDLTQEVARVWLERRPDLAQPPTGIHGVRAWLAAVTRKIAVDRVRSENARRARERSVSRAEACDDPYDVVERGAWQKRVTEAVMELPEPYRSTILYCYLDQLPTPLVAERMGARQATVRKRLERGLAMLRVRLGGEVEDAWQKRLAGILIMSTKAKLAGLALVVGLALWVALETQLTTKDAGQVGAATTRELEQPAEEPAQSRATIPSTSESSSRVATPDAGSKVSVPPAPTTGSLAVHVLWSDDKQPAPGVLVSLNRSGADPVFDEVSATSDEHGTVRFTELAPGKVVPQILRGASNWGDAVEIAAGAASECSVEVEVGMNCKGVVVDASGSPIGGAEVLVAGWADGRAWPLAVTASDGAFALRAVATHCHIGARARGYAASPLRQFTAGKGASVEMRIVLGDPAAELSGSVFDPQGERVANAVVQAGVANHGNQNQPDGTIVQAPMPARVRTDGDGHFEFHSLPAGSTLVSVRAPGLSTWVQSIELGVDRPTAITVQLEAGVTVVGTVRDDSGAAIAKPRISLGEWDELTHRSTTGDADGNFRIEGATAGELKLHVDSDEHGAAETTLPARSGETVRWDPVLSNGLVMSGLVLDPNGDPVKSAMVEARLEHFSRDARWYTFENTDESGRFKLTGCVAGEPIRITVRRKSTFPELILRNVIPSAHELVIRLPKEGWVYIQGKILDPEDKPLADVHVSPSMKGGDGSPAETTDPSTGAFRYGPYPPGEYQLQLHAAGYPEIRFPWRVLAADEVWDIGTVHFEKGGTLLVNASLASDRPPPTHLWLTIYDAGGVYVEQLDAHDGVGRSGLLNPGRYELQLGGENLASRLQTFDVRAGEETKLAVQLEPGITARIECAVPDWNSDDGAVEVVITDRSGTVVKRGMAWARESSPTLSACLLPGEYRVEASTTALYGRGTITIEPGDTAPNVSVRLARR